MKTFLSVALLGLSVLAAAQTEPWLSAQATYQNLDDSLLPINTVTFSDGNSVGPLSLDHTETFAHNSSDYTGVARVTADYGTLALYARTEITRQYDAPFYSRTEAYGSFFDPLAISGAGAGATLYAEMRLTAGIDLLSPGGAGWGYGVGVVMMVFDPTLGYWEQAPDQTLDSVDDGGFHTIDQTARMTLRNYDPIRQYALWGSASIAASRQAIQDYTDEVPFVEVDATHTATLTQLGFVGANGLYGRFEGASGRVYADAVPEPASLLALGAGLSFLRRRSRRV